MDRDRQRLFTKRAKRVMELAQEEARRHNHNYLGTEHVLLGIIAEGGGAGAQVLAELGIDLLRARETMAFHIGRGDKPVPEALNSTPRLDHAIDTAFEEMRALNHNFLGTEHLLLGVSRPEENDPSLPVSVMLLKEMDADPAEIRRRVLGLSGPNASLGSRQRPRDNVIACRVSDDALRAIDSLVEAGVYSTRSEAGARLILAGVEASRPLLEKIDGAVAEIRRVRDEAQRLASDWRRPSADGDKKTGAAAQGAAVSSTGESAH